MGKFTIYNLQFTIKILLLFFILYIVHFTFYIPTALAAESTPSSAIDVSSIGISRLDPSSPLYFLKSIREVMEIKFAGTEKVRVYRRLEFAQRRIREIHSLATLNREDLVQPNIEKFLFEITKIGPIKDKSLHSVVSQSLGHYMQTLVALHGNLTDSRAKLGVRRGIYALINYAANYFGNQDPLLRGEVFPPQEGKLVLGCDLLIKEAASLSLNESERQVLNERGKRCFEVLTTIIKK